MFLQNGKATLHDYKADPNPDMADQCAQVRAAFLCVWHILRGSHVLLLLPVARVCWLTSALRRVLFCVCVTYRAQFVLLLLPVVRVCWCTQKGVHASFFVWNGHVCASVPYGVNESACAGGRVCGAHKSRFRREFTAPCQSLERRQKCVRK